MSVRTAFITGLSGQDGSYLVEFLLEKGYYVEGIIRRNSSVNWLTRNSKDVSKNTNLRVHYGDITDSTCMHRLIREWYDRYCTTAERFEIYNLAAQSHVQVSFELPEHTNLTNVMGVYNVLNSIIALPASDRSKFRFYQASSSEMFGKVQTVPQNENTPFYPRSPYAVSKVAGYWATVNYRESFNLFACNGILFNHESPRRGVNFVTRKITKQIAEIIQNDRKTVQLGNLDAMRDWGHAKDYVEGMWLMLQQEYPQDFVLATGKQYSVRTFVEKAFKKAMDIDILWKGEGLTEIGVDSKNTDRVYVSVSEKFFRPAEVDSLLGDASKALKLLNWQPKIDIDTLVDEMVDCDLNCQ